MLWSLLWGDDFFLFFGEKIAIFVNSNFCLRVEKNKRTNTLTNVCVRSIDQIFLWKSMFHSQLWSLTFITQFVDFSNKQFDWIDQVTLTTARLKISLDVFRRFVKGATAEIQSSVQKIWSVFMQMSADRASFFNKCKAVVRFCKVLLLFLKAILRLLNLRLPTTTPALW
jgi:hypothetical protein